MNKVFERFTERARQVVVLAQEEARTLKHNYIGTEHILLGLLREGEGAAARTLEELGVHYDLVQSQVTRIIGVGEIAAPVDTIPYTPRAKKTFELALREALALGHNYIGTEHILLGLIREAEGVACRILFDTDPDCLDTIREAVTSRKVQPSNVYVAELKRAIEVRNNCVLAEKSAKRAREHSEALVTEAIIEAITHGLRPRQLPTELQESKAFDKAITALRNDWVNASYDT